MRLRIFLLCMFLFSSVFASDVYIVDGVRKSTSQNPVNYATTVNNTSVTTLSGSTQILHRIIINNGSNTVWMRKSSDNEIDIAGIPIYAKKGMIEDVYLGDIYLQTESGTSDVRIEIIYR